MTTQVSLKTLTCHTCGADLIFDPATQTTVCNYCGNSFSIEDAVDKAVAKPDGIFPFKVTKEQYQQQVLEWLIKGEYTPDDILESSIFDQVNGIYLPLFMYVVKYQAPWIASAGYKRLEDYLDNGSDGKLVTRTRTVIDWHPCRGDATGSFKKLIFAGDYKKIKPGIADFAANGDFAPENIKEYDQRYTLGFLMQEFVADEESIWNACVANLLQIVAKSEVELKIPGDCHRDVSFDLTYEKKSFRIFAPYWIVCYKYKGKEYHICMDGMKASRIDGIRPEDQGRKDTISRFFRPVKIFLLIWIPCLLGFTALVSADAGALLLLDVIPLIVLITRAFIKKKALIDRSLAIRKQILAGYKTGKKAIKNQGANEKILSPLPKTLKKYPTRTPTKPKTEQSSATAEVFIIVAIILLTNMIGALMVPNKQTHELATNGNTEQAQRNDNDNAGHALRNENTRNADIEKNKNMEIQKKQDLLLVSSALNATDASDNLADMDKSLRQLSERTPNDLEAKKALGHICFLMRKTDASYSAKAIDLLSQAYSHSTGTPDSNEDRFKLELVRLYIDSNNTLEANTVLSSIKPPWYGDKTCIDIMPTNRDYHELHAEVDELNIKLAGKEQDKNEATRSAARNYLYVIYPMLQGKTIVDLDKKYQDMYYRYFELKMTQSFSYGNYLELSVTMAPSMSDFILKTIGSKTNLEKLIVKMQKSPQYTSYSPAFSPEFVKELKSKSSFLK